MKEELRNQVFRQMCDCAENISTYYFWDVPFTGMHFIDGLVPETFKPGVADKFLFNKIIDGVIDNIYNELSNGELKTSLMGTNVMVKYYYPQFGVWREMPSRRELFRRIYNTD